MHAVMEAFMAVFVFVSLWQHANYCNVICIHIYGAVQEKIGLLQIFSSFQI